MRIAILGANSQIAKDLILSFAAARTVDLTLFARRPADVAAWLASVRVSGRFPVADYSQFESNVIGVDGIINFVGSGNPAHTAAMGSSILQVTQQYDELVLRQLEDNPDCRYVFFSSGAAYGGDFTLPADENTLARVPLNHMQGSDWYGLAKLYAECRHRALPHLSIVDVRVFNYFSHTQDIGQRFLITDILRAIVENQSFQTSAANIVRDYLGPQDMFQLIKGIMDAPACNSAVDCYTRAPVDKLTMLAAMRTRFGLRYAFDQESIGFTATGSKNNYYSTSRKAASFFNYAPKFSALETVLEQAERKLEQTRAS